MFILKDREGATVRMRNGEAFLYTSRTLAYLARKILENDRKTSLVVVPV